MQYSKSFKSWEAPATALQLSNLAGSFFADFRRGMKEQDRMERVMVSGKSETLLPSSCREDEWHG